MTKITNRIVKLLNEAETLKTKLKFYQELLNRVNRFNIPVRIDEKLWTAEELNAELCIINTRLKEIEEEILRELDSQ